MSPKSDLSRFPPQKNQLLELTVADHATAGSALPNQATAIDAAIRDLYVGEGEEGMAHVDITSVIDALVEGTAGDVRLQIQRSDGQRDLFPEILSERNMWNDLALEVTDTARDFAMTLWEDRNGNSFVDAGEQQLTVKVHVINLFTDSNNDGTFDLATDTYAENGVGKRIFINTDDDNKNGIADVNDKKAAYTATSTQDNDFAEILLVIGDANPLAQHYEWQFRCTTDGLNLYASKAKDALTPATGGWGYKWTPELEKIAEDSEIRRIFAEGTKLGPQTIEYRLFDTTKGIAFGPTKTLKIKVEKIVYPFQDQVANWSTQDTAQWKGLAVGEAWYIDKALIDYIVHPDFNFGTKPEEQKNSLETRRPIGSVAPYDVFSKDKDSYVNDTDSSHFANGFTMEFDYSFAKNHGNEETGYVQAERKRHQVSFVGNSGVKFGTSGVDASGKPMAFEINILDVPSMYLDGTTNNHRLKIQDNGDVTIYQENGKPFSEPLNKLMAGVRYGGDYTKMLADWGKADPPANAADYTKILNANMARNTGHMKVEMTKEAGGTYHVKVSINGITTYDEGGIALTVGIPHLQTHWGSGVVFTNVQFT